MLSIKLLKEVESALNYAIIDITNLIKFSGEEKQKEVNRNILKMWTDARKSVMEEIVRANNKSGYRD